MGKRKSWIILLGCCLIAAVVAAETAPGGLQASEHAAAEGAAGAIRAASASAEAPGKEKGEVKTAAATVRGELPPGMELVVENDMLQLLLDPETTVVAVKDKRSGELWSTNPEGRDEDRIATAVNKKELASQLILSYYNDRGHEAFMNNAADSVEKGQFEIETDAGGVTVTYEIGSSEKGLSAIPVAVSKERFEKRILGQIEDEDARGRLRSRFFYNEEKALYERKDMQDYIVKDVVAILQSIGYTAEEAKRDSEQAANQESEEDLAPRFTVPIRYELDGQHLIARIDTTKVTDSEAFPLHEIQLLPFFGAAGQDEEGYMLVPDGSGALIALNETNKGARAYEVPLYGEDYTPKSEEGRQVQFEQISRLPVFGMKRGDEAMFAIIEQGDAQASVTADTSGKLNSYNRVGALFRLKDMEPVEFRAGSVTRQVPKYSDLYDGGIAVRYSFLSGDDADYAGMASAYRRYLVEKHGLKPLEAEEDTPFVMELVGAIPVRKTFMGVPYRSTRPVTTFKQATSILDELQNRGVFRIDLRYSGWFNEGYYHSLPDSVKPDESLGGRKGWERLLAYAEERNIEVYPDVAFQRVYVNGKGFKATRDGARFLNRKAAKRYKQDLVTTNPEGRAYYVLSPRKLDGVVDGFLKSYSSYGASGLSLRDLGEDLNSDIPTKGTIDRQDAAGIAEQNMEKFRAASGNVMISGGNAYALPYASTIVNAPLTSSGFNIAPEQIPFYSMVLHGYVDLAGAPLNHGRNQDSRAALLRTLETGSILYYQWFYEEPSVIRDTKLNYLFSPYYANWLDEAAQLYKETNETLREVRGQTIANHRKLADGVYETTFEKGLRIIVNYKKEAVTEGGLTIEAQGFRVIGGEGV
ncbi:DUF5696 domain-containing protein [Paenibacillus sp. LHD-117]|uniref:DUF5696 domain-containing protein n=1 Tax=Paenibacillus sp. LHD-117 TaxID=3071412 RepID=UPI0027DF034B|nr:DUF5696 domain-containing protein [Paenibacillus sp. LHD-117]MDQ6421868.1 DUF5696 domain-containing protein [Paenibacillus sp. LHD-117]